MNNITIKIIEKEKQRLKYKDVTKNYRNILNTNGVWALFEVNDKNLLQCLQVGQTQNIASEITYDIKCISGQIIENHDIHYINQFGQDTKFTYISYLTAREQLYKYIGDHYTDLSFICICYGDNYKDNLKGVEKYIAWKLKPLYWRNGGQYKNKKEVSEPKNISDNIPDDIITKVGELIKTINYQNVSTE